MSSLDVDQWKDDLAKAGWVAESSINWRAPDGSLWRGPAGAWKELQRRRGWFTDWPTVGGFYWIRGWREYRDLPIKVDGDEFWTMFGGAKYHKSDLEDSDNVQFQGPIAPSD